jgi:glutamyl-tRNA synthetase
VNRDGRYAPSPTGPLHLGNLRTALVAWLMARAAGARFVVRIEDLDPGRSRERWVSEQLDDLAALGIEWDGEPIRQSDRAEIYADAVERLWAQGLLYECFCTRAEIREAASAPHGKLPGGHYPGTCRELSPGQRRTRAASGRPPALRVRAEGERAGFTDRLRGEVETALDDFVVRRNDGAHAYNLAVIVDDAAQGIGEVVRGADLLDTTGRQLWLAARLGLEPPGYAHVPLVLGSDGERLAKRHGAVTLSDRRALGETPEQVRAMLVASLGISDPGVALSAAELVERFDPGALATADGPLAE